MSKSGVLRGVDHSSTSPHDNGCNEMKGQVTEEAKLKSVQVFAYKNHLLFLFFVDPQGHSG